MEEEGREWEEEEEGERKRGWEGERKTRGRGQKGEREGLEGRGNWNERATGKVNG